jgi:hypothetical protein
MTTSGIELFQILRQKVGESEAEALVGFIDAKIKENNEVNLKIVASKEDVAMVKGDIAVVKEDIAKLEGRLSVKITESKADVLKWMFGGFFAMMLALIGLYFKK